MQHVQDRVMVEAVGAHARVSSSAVVRMLVYVCRNTRSLCGNGRGPPSGDAVVVKILRQAFRARF